jgi:hypothetical protein
MEVNSVTFAPPYSILFISDGKIGEVPDPDGHHLRFSESAVTITCLNEQEGETRVTLGPSGEIGLAETLAFDGFISTPSRRVVVSTAHDEIVLQAEVATTKTRVRIWENDPAEPDDIVIGLN